MIPYDSNKSMNPSGIRLGTAAMTSRGLVQSDFVQIADWIDQIIKAKGDLNVINKVKSEVKTISKIPNLPRPRLLVLLNLINSTIYIKSTHGLYFWT